MWWNLPVLDEQALFIAIPVRHLEAALDAQSSGGERTVLPAGGPGDLDDAPAGTPVLVMPTDAGDSEVPAATWRATFVRRVPYVPGSAWPEGLPTSWTDEHPVPEAAAPADPDDDPDDDPDGDRDDDPDDDPDDDAWEDDEDAGPQSFLEVVDLGPLPRQEWLFANELVGKQARGGRWFQPLVPTLVDLPD